MYRARCLVQYATQAQTLTSFFSSILPPENRLILTPGIGLKLSQILSRFEVCLSFRPYLRHPSFFALISSVALPVLTLFVSIRVGRRLPRWSVLQPASQSLEYLLLGTGSCLESRQVNTLLLEMRNRNTINDAMKPRTETHQPTTSDSGVGLSTNCLYLSTLAL